VAEDWESLKALMEADGAERKMVADDNRGIGDGDGERDDQGQN
jgi:hypothetical protein